MRWWEVYLGTAIVSLLMVGGLRAVMEGLPGPSPGPTPAPAAVTPAAAPSLPAPAATPAPADAATALSVPRALTVRDVTVTREGDAVVVRGVLVVEGEWGRDVTVDGRRTMFTADDGTRWPATGAGGEVRLFPSPAPVQPPGVPARWEIRFEPGPPPGHYYLSIGWWVGLGGPYMRTAQVDVP